MYGRVTRRRFLGAIGAGVSASLAGCWGHGPSLSLTAVDESSLHAKAVRSITPAAPPDRHREVARTIENGANVVHSLAPEPQKVRPARPVVASLVESPVEYGGDYYTIALTDRVTTPLVAADVRIRTAENVTDESRAIEYAALSDRDRAALDRSVPLEPPHREYEETVSFYDGEDENASVLLPGGGNETVRRDGTLYAVAVTSTERKRGYSYHYSSTRVATTKADFIDWLRGAYRFDLTGLSEAKREIVDEAIDDFYTDNEDAFKSLSERFLGRPALEREDNWGDWVVRYEGSEYVADLQAPTSRPPP